VKRGDTFEYMQIGGLGRVDTLWLEIYWHVRADRAAFRRQRYFRRHLLLSYLIRNRNPHMTKHLNVIAHI